MNMGEQPQVSLRKRIIGGALAAYAASVLAVTPFLSWKSHQQDADATPLTVNEIMPSAQALVWPTYVWQKLTSPPFEDPLHAKAAAELQKFNRIWYFVAEVNNSMAARQTRYHDPISFLAACKGFDDYIANLHNMIYASRTLDVHVLNGIYPELGTRFQNSWRKGASLMLNACIDGSPREYMASKAASNEWFAWYDGHGNEIEAALKKVAVH